MNKAIYSLKMFEFREQLPLTQEQIDGLREVCIYITLIHVKAWFTAPLAAAAPRHDLQLLKDLVKHEKINPEVAKVALDKITSQHLWYLSEQLVPLD